MEKISLQTILISIGVGVAATLISGIILEIYQTVPSADFEIKVRSAESINSTTLSQIKVKNTGEIPARNVTVILNPENDIIDYSPGLQMERFELVLHGPRSLFVEIPRLANGAEISVNTILNVTNTEREGYHVFVVSDQGSQIHHEGSYTDNLLRNIASLVIGFVTGVATATFPTYYLRRREERRKHDYEILGVGH